MSRVKPLAVFQMSRKINEFLDASDDEHEDESGNESDTKEDTRFGSIPSKRRKLDLGISQGSVNEDNTAHPDVQTRSSQAESPLKKGSAVDYFASTSRAGLKPLTPGELSASQAKARKTGVIYVSRIPPFMKPSAMRNLLSPYGEILRIFLTPEPTPAYQKRVRSGGNKKRSFVDGWIEFASKKKAKVVAETLNGNVIGGKKGSWYHDDIWNMKYLKGFKWSDLMEQVQNEEREREGRLRAEIAREAKERKAFLKNLDLDKKNRGIQAKRKKGSKGTDLKFNEQTVETVDGNDAIIEKDQRERGEMRFTQNKVTDPKGATGETTKQRDELHRVLSRIF